MAKKVTDEQHAAAAVEALLRNARRNQHGRDFLKSLPDAVRGDAHAVASDHRERMARER